MFLVEILVFFGEVLIFWIMSDRVLIDEEDFFFLLFFGGFVNEGWFVCLWLMDCFVGLVWLLWKILYGGFLEEEVEDFFFLELFSGFFNEVFFILGWFVNGFLGFISMSLDIRLSFVLFLDVFWFVDDSFSDFLLRFLRIVCLVWICGICLIVVGLVREFVLDVCLKIEVFLLFLVDLVVYDFCEYVDCDLITFLFLVFFWFLLLFCRLFFK